MRFFSIYLLAACLAASPCSVLAELKVGTAMRVVTPKPLLPISGGVGPGAPAKEKKGELSVRAAVFSNGATTLAIVSVDALGFPSVLGDRARAKTEGILPDHILIGASHTHSAPDFYAFPDGKGGHTGDLPYMDFVCDQMADALNEANNTLRTAKLRIGTGKVEGKIAYNYYAPDLYDRRASVVQAADENGDAIVTLVNYAIHPEVLGANSGVCSPDLVGPLRDCIETRLGGMAMFINGAQGGMVTADNRDLDKPTDPVRAYWEDSRTWDECIRIGNLLGRESIRIVQQSQWQHEPRLTCHVRRVRFPVQSHDMWAIVENSPLNYPRNADQSVTAQMNLIQIGNARILSIPGEALPNIGFYLKRKMGAEHNLLFGLTNDAFGYILTKEDYNSFDRYNYISTVSLGEMTGHILVENALEMFEQVQK